MSWKTKICFAEDVLENKKCLLGTMCREEKLLDIITRLRNSCLITFFKKIQSSHQRYRKSHRRCSVKKRVLKNFANFIEKHLCWSLFLIKLQAFSLNFFWKETPTQVLPWEVCETFKLTPILKKTCKRLLLESIRTIVPEKNCPPDRVGVSVKVRVSFRVGGQPDNCPGEKLPLG